MRTGRMFSKRIDLYRTVSVSDGYGGNLVSEAKVTGMWANMIPVKVGANYNISDFGIIDSNYTVIVTIRNNPNLSIDVKKNFFVYRGYKYVISTAPVNEGFADAYLKFVLTRVNKMVNSPGGTCIMSIGGSTGTEFLLSGTLQNGCIIFKERVTPAIETPAVIEVTENIIT